MQKKKLFYILVLSLTFNACGDDDTTIPVHPPIPVNESLVVSESSFRTTYRSGTKTVSITTSSEWKAECKSSPWLTLSPALGKGNGDMVVSWTENTRIEERSATITVKAGSLEKQIRVVQAAKADTAHLVSTRAVIGNMINNETDSFELTFDKPVKLLERNLNNGLYSVDYNPTYSDDNRSFKFAFKAGRMGMDLKFDFTVASLSDGTKTTGSCNFAFYQQKFVLDNDYERISHAVVSDDDKSIWLSVAGLDFMGGGSKLLQLSLQDCSIMQTVDMPFAPGYLTFNPYNGLLYVMPMNTIADYGFSNTFCIVDPKQGKITKNISIEASPYTHPQHPAIYPSELEFTKDGLGILLLVENAGESREWRYVDSAKDHEISYSGYRWSEFQFEHVYHNYNHTRIYANPYPGTYHELSYITRDGLQPTTYIVDTSFASDKYYAGGTLVDMKLSPFDEKVFISTAPGSQCVVSLGQTVSYSEVIEAEARLSKAAWDKLSSDRSLVYQVCGLDGSFLLLDMDRADCIFYGYHKWNELLDVIHLPANDQVAVIAHDGIWLFDAAYMKNAR